MPELTKKQLENIYNAYNKAEFISPDPLEFLYKYENPLDIELVGFISAAFAFGKVSQILKTLELIFSKLGDSPTAFIQENNKQLHQIFKDFQYRFVKADELVSTLNNLQRIYQNYGNLENCFLEGYNDRDETIVPAIQNFIKELKCGGNYLVPKHNSSGACKRLNLFFRWMVRDDNVDLGLWKKIPKSKLIIPLDTHIANISRHFGLTARKTASMSMALEITEGFKKFSPDDPVKYDFSLTRFGIRDDMSMKDLHTKT